MGTSTVHLDTVRTLLRESTAEVAAAQVALEVAEAMVEV